jgi:hypothetical protein
LLLPLSFEPARQKQVVRIFLSDFAIRFEPLAKKKKKIVKEHDQGYTVGEGMVRQGNHISHAGSIGDEDV